MCVCVCVCVCLYNKWTLWANDDYGADDYDHDYNDEDTIAITTTTMNCDDGKIVTGIVTTGYGHSIFSGQLICRFI